MNNRIFAQTQRRIMECRAAAGLDPLSGRPVMVQWPISVKDGHAVDATGREVYVTEHGDYDYRTIQ